ncbi:UNVERIFIED_CONTAM: hypothetical protein Sradi_0484500 [Sesamum radiatum]|uniref:Reverse transcriptase domain-containing protein n=1 Tax=Sesamum radiatum TaxID=300843 RepID=A0AAW2W930_SESRA
MFRFDNYLARSVDFIPSVRRIWQHHIVGTAMFGVTRKLKALKQVFRAQRQRKGDLSNNARLAAGFLEETQSLLAQDRHCETLLHLELCCKDGDQCSRIFFSRVAKRRSSKRVFQITDSEGQLRTTPPEVTEAFIDYYQTLLGGRRRNQPIDLRFLRPWARHFLTEDEACLLIIPVTEDEVKLAIFNIDETKAPGPDGYSCAFFKAAWPIVGGEVTRAIIEFFRTGRLLRQLNATLITLIPKVSNPTVVGEFRPISCCNVLYKAITKILVQRMRGTLDKLISPSQNAFVPGRSITLFGFPVQFITWIIECVSTPSYSVCLNGCLMASSAAHGAYGREIPCLHSSLCLSWNKADMLTVLVFKRALTTFAELSGLHANLQKSHLILSRAASPLRDTLLATLDFQEGHLPLRYLGLPLLASRLTIADCQPLLHRIDDRIKGWEGIMLSFAGRVQLIKSVLSALQIYWAMAFILPKHLIKEIEKRLR